MKISHKKSDLSFPKDRSFSRLKVQFLYEFYFDFIPYGNCALRRSFFYGKPVRHRPKEAAQANIKNPRRKERRGIKDGRAVHRIAAWYIHGALFLSGGRSISGRYGIFFEKDLPELPLYDIMKKNFIMKRLQEEKLKWQIGLKKMPRDIGDSEN